MHFAGVMDFSETILKYRSPPAEKLIKLFLDFLGITLLVLTSRTFLNLKLIPRVYLELLVKYSSRYLARTPIKTHKGAEKWPLFVNMHLFWWSTSITLDNNRLFRIFFHFIIPYTPVGLTSCISIVFISFEYVDLFDHYAASWFNFKLDLRFSGSLKRSFFLKSKVLPVVQVYSR